MSYPQMQVPVMVSVGCPTCHSDEYAVLETRQPSGRNGKFHVIRRRRQCINCEICFMTFVISSVAYRVLRLFLVLSSKVA
jgi:transcriptional regulator NrdR family protein